MQRKRQSRDSVPVVRHAPGAGTQRTNPLRDGWFAGVPHFAQELIGGVALTELKEETWMADNGINDILGMSENELYGYLNDLLHEEAAEAAEESGKTVEEELDSAGFAAAGAASTYAIKLILANNAYLTRQLLDIGVLSTEEDEE